jgi:capsular polysaccharide biosynthesis protein
MRHTYLTEKYANLMKKQKVMEEDMENMGSSTKQAKVYVKLK